MVIGAVATVAVAAAPPLAAAGTEVFAAIAGAARQTLSAQIHVAAVDAANRVVSGAVATVTVAAAPPLAAAGTEVFAAVAGAARQTLSARFGPSE
jgi:hypothetical protein